MHHLPLFLAGSRDATSTSVDGTLVPPLAKTAVGVITGVPIGSIGFGMTSGTVFRALPGGATNHAIYPVGGGNHRAYSPASRWAQQPTPVRWYMCIKQRLLIELRIYDVQVYL